MGFGDSRFSGGVLLVVLAVAHRVGGVVYARRFWGVMI